MAFYQNATIKEKTAGISPDLKSFHKFVIKKAHRGGGE